jgi:hypothetical protein
MNGSPPRLPTPANAWSVPAMLAIVYGCSLIAAWGFTSLLIDVDVITEKDAGPLLGPAMATAAIVVTFLSLLRVRKARSVTWAAVSGAASVWIAMLAVGAIGYTLTRGELAWLALFAGKYSTSPFVVLPTLLTAAAILIGAAIMRGRRPPGSFDRIAPPD